MNWISTKEELPFGLGRVRIALDEAKENQTVAYLEDNRPCSWSPMIEEEHGYTEAEWLDKWAFFLEPHYPWRMIDISKVYWWAELPEEE